MNKKELLKKCEELGIDANDSLNNAQLELMIAGKESAAKITELETKIESLTSENEALKAAYEDLVKENKKTASLAGGNVAKGIELDGKLYKVAFPKLSTKDNAGKPLVLNGDNLEEHAEVCKRLIEAGSGFLVEVES